MVPVFGIALSRGEMFPRVAAIRFIVGGILLNVPTWALPRLSLISGGLSWSIAAV